MIYVMLLLAICSLLGIAYNKQTNNSIFKDNIIEYKKNNNVANLMFIIILIIMILFAGLRTVGNDTGNYIVSFKTKIPSTLSGIKETDWTIGSNPLFYIYRVLIKSLISTNPHVFIFFTAIIVTTSYLLFIKKYSVDFGFTLFILIAFTVYAFTMAAIKQTLATAIAIWSIPLFVNKKKILKPSILILIAMLIHPYVLIFFATPFFTKNIWDRRTWMLLLVTIIIGIFFTEFTEGILGIAEELGDSGYDESSFTNSTGMSLFRVAVYLVIPALSFLYKENIRKTDNKFFFTCINLSFISAAFMVISSFGGAILLGRMGNYFDIINCLSFAIILKCGIIDQNEKSIIYIISLVCFIYFYYTYFSKYLNGDWMYDFYQHIPLSDLFK